ncbi:MAG: RNA 2',3'-cyclic phosphodiesterase [Spirochaetia bacterium]|jgi:2'-5' RNA ligase|nr:RNA 2',3'-cyclic phosphodiesterase [Spirochaetia bacterium]
MRLFIAAEIDNKNKKLIHHVQEKYKGSSLGGNFTRMENYHITLRFLGEVKDELIPKIRFSMENMAKDSSPFIFSAGCPGYFSRRDGLILWLGIDKGAEKLWEISSLLDDELFKAGFPKAGSLKEGFSKEKDIFTPHITLGRKVRLRKDFREVTDHITIPQITVNTKEITLMSSIREKGKLCYRPLFSVKLFC